MRGVANTRDFTINLFWGEDSPVNTVLSQDRTVQRRGNRAERTMLGKGVRVPPRTVCTDGWHRRVIGGVGEEEE